MNREKEMIMVDATLNIEFVTGEIVYKEFETETTQQVYDIVSTLLSQLQKAGNMVERYSVSASTGQCDLF
jgi:hypothetical protein